MGGHFKNQQQDNEERELGLGLNPLDVNDCPKELCPNVRRQAIWEH